MLLPTLGCSLLLSRDGLRSGAGALSELLPQLVQRLPLGKGTVVAE